MGEESAPMSAVTALIDEAYAKKLADKPTTPEYRVRKASELIEEYWRENERKPANGVLSRLAWYIDLDYYANNNPHKVSAEEYPVLSEHQLERRRKRERSLAEVYTGKGDETIGRRTDVDGVKRRVYDYMTPKRDMALIPSKYLDLYSAIDNAGLTERQRQAIELVYFEGMTQEDAAEEMSIKQPNINAYIDAGTRKIRVYMVELNDE